MARIPQFKRAARAMGDLLVKVGPLPRRAESRMQMGRAPRERLSSYFACRMRPRPGRLNRGFQGSRRRRGRRDNYLDLWGRVGGETFFRRLVRGKRPSLPWVMKISKRWRRAEMPEGIL